MPQSLLITGSPGLGLTTIAEYMAEAQGAKPTIILPEKDERIDLDKGMISIDIMRRLYDETRTKNTKKNIIIIDYAERMTHQAQNSFLKLLEEPNDNTYFILVANTTGKLLPTILSRVKKIEIKPITDKQTNELLDNLGVNDNTKRAQITFMANGLPAEITLMANDEDYFTKQSSIVRDARELLRGSKYQKLLIAHKYKDDRQAVLKLLTVASKILKMSIQENPSQDMIERLNDILNTYERIVSNGNIRLNLAKISL